MTIYKELFTVNILHKSYTTPYQSRLSECISIQPDDDTKILFTNHYIDFRFFDNTLICFMRCKQFNPPAIEPKVPFLNISGDVRIRFQLQATNDFLKKTIIDMVGAKKVYYFSNRINVGTNKFISQHKEGVNDDDLMDVIQVGPENPCFGVFDIYTKNAKNNDYELFSAQQLNNPEYKIRFKSKNL